MKPRSKKIRVILADDHSILTEGLASLLRDDVDLIGVAKNGRELVEMAERLKPDVIVSDVSMPILNGLDALRILRKTGNAARVIILTMYDEAALAAEAFDSGANGYLGKQTVCTELLTAIREVFAGKIYLSSRLKSDFEALQASKQRPEKGDERISLSSRQKEILQLTAEGKAPTEIAAILHISPTTLSSHQFALMKLLGLSSNAEFINFAAQFNAEECS